MGGTIPVITTCSPPRRGSRASCDRAGRRAGVALVSPRAAAHPCRHWIGARLVVRLDVRVPDARARLERADGKPARPDGPARRRPSTTARNAGAVGRLEAAFNAPGPRPHLPVLELRRRRARAKRGLTENYVVAPYATALAAMVDPVAAARDFERLAGRGPRRLRLLRGARLHGRPSPGRTDARRRQSVHGASPGDDDRRAREHAARRGDAPPLHEPIVRATELLLQERTPRTVAVARPRAEGEQPAARARLRPARSPAVRLAHDHIPRTHLLSNGRYSVMMTAAGSVTADGSTAR